MASSSSMLTFSTKTPTNNPHPSLFPTKTINPRTYFQPNWARTRIQARPVGVRSELIKPDGGKLSQLVVDEPLRQEKKGEAMNLPRILLTNIDIQWVHVLSEGWASPLNGFMRENEFLQTLHFNSIRLEDGSVVNMSVPIVLPIDDECKTRIGESDRVALFDPDGVYPIAILTKLEEIASC